MWLKQALISVMVTVALTTGDAQAYSYFQRRNLAKTISENACLHCHGNQPPVGSATQSPPLLSPSFSMNWFMYEFEGERVPPFSTILLPYRISRGRTHYDWATRKMTEIYEDRCIDIFPSGNEFSCQFLSVREKTYFIRYALGDLSKAESCCLWSKEPFWAPRPDVLLNMSFQQNKEINQEPADLWFYDIPLPGPFGYATARNSSRPVAFWFPVIGGWVQQNFSHYVSTRPDSAVFELPGLCTGHLDVCSQE